MKGDQGIPGRIAGRHYMVYLGPTLESDLDSILIVMFVSEISCFYTYHIAACVL